MDKKDLEIAVQARARTHWLRLCVRYPQLVDFEMPTIVLNGRTWRTAGVCYQQENRVELSTKFLRSSATNYIKMLRVILPHELIHQADFNLHGESEKRCGHGRTWSKIMLEYGLPADKYHDMEIER